MGSEDGIDGIATNHVSPTDDPGEQTTTAVAGKPVRFRDRWSNPEYRRNVWRTVWLGATFWGLGFSVGQRGPAFLDIQIITGTNVEQASFFFTANSVGYLLGSLVAGVVYDLLNKSLLFLSCVVGLAVTTVILPWCSPYWLMIVIHMIVAFFGGAIDTSGNAELVRIWGKEGEMAMQFIHFAFALGGVISPLATEPFLTPTPDDDMDTTTIIPPLTSDNDSDVWNSSSTTPGYADNSTAPPPPLTTNVHYAFMISGGIILLIAVPLTVQLFSDRSSKRRQDRKDEKPDIKQPYPLVLFLFVQGTLCLFYLLYCAVEDTYASFLTAFVVKQLHWTKSGGAQLSSVYWASFAAGRFLCIFVIYVLSSVKLLTLSSISLFLAMVAMLVFSAHNVSAGVWVSAVLAGVTMAPIFPTGFTWMEEELVRVTGRVSSSILIASSSGMMVNPIIVGTLMQDVNPMWFAYILVVVSALTVGVFFFLLALSRLYLRKRYSQASLRTKTMEIFVSSGSVDANPDKASTA